jgi:SAM-dependent methyltransferase
VVEDGAVDGYTSSSYGDAFADVYDEWYADLSDRDATVDVVAALTPAAGRVLELGVGTGRLAIPIATALRDRGATVIGLDASAAMLDRLADRDVAALVDARQGDMVEDLPPGPFDVVLVAYNTLFNLLTAPRQEQCLAAVGRQLADGGVLLAEAFVPEEHPTRQDELALRSMRVDEVVLSVSRATSDQRVEGQYISISEAGGVRLRPWAIRWCTPDQLDDMARRGGLAPVGRWASFTGEPFDEHSARHVTAYAVADRHEEASALVRKVLG